MDAILVGLAERVKALELSQDINLRAIEQRLVALEAVGEQQRVDAQQADRRELARLRQEIDAGKVGKE